MYSIHTNYVEYIIIKVCRIDIRLAFAHKQSPLLLYVNGDETNLNLIILVIIESSNLNMNSANVTIDLTKSKY